MNARSFIGLAALFLAACSTVVPAPAPPAAPDAQTLLGTWTVDLRPRPDAPAYLKTLVVTSVSGNTFEGSFYDSAITQGRINVGWGAVRIAFVTADLSGPYNHSAVLSGQKLDGLTNATGRGFLSYWSAVKR